MGKRIEYLLVLNFLLQTYGSAEVGYSGMSTQIIRLNTREECEILGNKFVEEYKNNLITCYYKCIAQEKIFTSIGEYND